MCRGAALRRQRHHLAAHRETPAGRRPATPPACPSTARRRGRRARPPCRRPPSARLRRGRLRVSNPPHCQIAAERRAHGADAARANACVRRSAFTWCSSGEYSPPLISGDSPGSRARSSSADSQCSGRQRRAVRQLPQASLFRRRRRRRAGCPTSGTRCRCPSLRASVSASAGNMRRLSTQSAWNGPASSTSASGASMPAAAPDASPPISPRSTTSTRTPSRAR